MSLLTTSTEEELFRYEAFVLNKIHSLFNTAQLSPCVKRRLAAIIFDPLNLSVISEAYNDHLMQKSSGDLCGGDHCLRISQQLHRGRDSAVGCMHAETLAILNVASSSASTRGMHLLVIGEPCKMCSKNIAAARLSRVNIVTGGYPGIDEGVAVLNNAGVEVGFYPMPEGYTTRSPL